MLLECMSAVYLSHWLGRLFQTRINYVSGLTNPNPSIPGAERIGKINLH